MDQKEFIAFLYRTGHFWNPADPSSWNVTPDQLPKLTLNDRVVRSAVQSFQNADANLTPIAMAIHGRGPIADGDVGPATLELADLPRCPMPDHVPPPGVLFQLPTRADGSEVSGLACAVDTMKQFATGSGGWPASGCDPQRKGVHSIRVSISTRNMPSKVGGYIREALAHSVACYAEIGIAVRYLLDGGTDAEIVKYFEPLAGSVIGWNYFPSPNSCRRIEGRLDTSFTPDMKTWANLEVHETGHGVGLQHTNGHIMNPSLNVVWPLSYRGGPSESTLRRYYGGEPLKPIIDNMLI